MNIPQVIPARVVAGHRVASGGKGDPRFPGGTLRMQYPFFRELGLDLTHFYNGTVNVSIAPWCYQPVKPRLTFRQLKWHPTEPAEDFSFFDFSLLARGGEKVPGLIYYPHPETKPEHFQRPDVLELLLPFVQGITYGLEVNLEIPSAQMLILPPANAGTVEKP